MNQQYKTTGGIITGVILIFCGVIVSPVAIGMSFSYPDGIWIIGIVLTICSAVLIFSGINNIRKARQEEARAIKFLLDIHKESLRQKESISYELKIQEERKTTVTAPIILAEWEYTPKQWAEFFKEEKKDIKIQSIIFLVIFSILGTVVLKLSKGASWFLAFGISFVIGGVIGLLNYFLKKNTFEVTTSKMIKVIIGLDTITINGKLVVLRDEDKWLSKVELISDQKPYVIEFTYRWNTRKGEAFDTIRIPLPDNRLEEAKEVTTRITSFHNI